MDPQPSTIRTRWAAIGAAVAITLGAGGIGVVGATINSGERTSFVAMTPCRLMDLRPATNVGPRNTPIGEQEELVVAAHGVNGNCTITDQATGLVLNITAVDPTAATNLRVFPADQPLPTTSNLNPTPGSPPTPNAVTTGLDASGHFKIFNAFGKVDVIADVVGYYEDHDHDDRYPLKTDVYTKAQVESMTAASRTQVILGTDFDIEDPEMPHDRPFGAFRFHLFGDACAFAPVRLEAGTVVGRIEVVHHAYSHDASMTIQLAGRSLTTDSSIADVDDEHLVAFAVFDGLTENIVQTKRLTVSPRVALREDYAYALRICSDDALSIRRAKIEPGSIKDIDPLPFDPPIGLDPGI